MAKTQDNWNKGIHGESSDDDESHEALKDLGKDTGIDLLIGAGGDAANALQYAVQTQAPAQEPDGDDPDQPLSGNLN